MCLSMKRGAYTILPTGEVDASICEDNDDDNDHVEPTVEQLQQTIAYIYDDNLRLQAQVVRLEADLASVNRRLAYQQQIMQQLQTVALLHENDIESHCHGSNRLVHSSSCDDDVLAAAQQGDIALFRCRLRSSPTNETEEEIISRLGSAALTVACQYGHTDIAEFLLERQVDVQVEHNSPLQWAAQRGDKTLTKLLLRHGANPKELNNCPLRLATHMGHYDVAEIIRSAINRMDILSDTDIPQ